MSICWRSSHRRRSSDGQQSGPVRLLWQIPLARPPVAAFFLIAFFLLFLFLASYNLGLPGLHYDEAKEAGLNAMELLTGAPVTVFRRASVSLSGVQLPLMVQDYIGALNVYLALPLLWLTGIGVPNLRALAILTALAALLLLERTVSEWMCLCRADQGALRRRAPLSLAGVIAGALLSVSPSFIFWSRQGIFVTNIMQPLTLACIWQGVRWLRLGRRRSLLLSAFWGGLALYAKVQAVWLVGPLGLLAGGWWLWQQRTTPPDAAETQAYAPITILLLVGALGAFMLPLLPLILFNVQTGGLWSVLSRNAQTSYYGVNNADWVGNLAVRWQQWGQMLRGDHFWYLGGVYGNVLAPWLWGVFIGSGLWRWPKVLVGPLLLLLAAFGLSLFTISDLFITHFALLQPLAYGVAGVAGAQWLHKSATVLEQQGKDAKFWLYGRRGIVILLLLVWMVLDVTATVRYHGALNRSGGLADHSDASYHLAYYLRHKGLGAPIALDWGIDAPVRFLSQGSVTPIEIFGYDSVAEPDADFEERLALFLPNPDNVYLLRAEAQTVFRGRRQLFLDAVAEQARTAVLVQTFAQRDGTPLFEVWRAP